MLLRPCPLRRITPCGDCILLEASPNGALRELGFTQGTGARSPGPTPNKAVVRGGGGDGAVFRPRWEFERVFGSGTRHPLGQKPGGGNGPGMWTYSEAVAELFSGKSGPDSEGQNRGGGDTERRSRGIGGEVSPSRGGAGLYNREPQKGHREYGAGTPSWGQRGGCQKKDAGRGY